MGTQSSNDPISLETLSKRIAEVKAEATEKLSAMQQQIDTLRSDFNEKDLKTQRRVVRVTSLIDNIMTDFQNVIGILGEMSDKISAAEKRGTTLAGSIAKNKQNLNTLSKYFKEMNKSWKAVQSEIDKLNEANESNTQFHWKIVAGAGFLFSAAILLIKSGNWDAFWNFIQTHFAIF